MDLDPKTINELKIDRGAARSGEPRRWWIWAIPLGLVLAALGWFFLRPRAAVVQVAPAEELSASAGTASVLDASGYITARRSATISSKLSGIVVAVMVEEGMRVEKGQLLARLEPTIPSQTLQLSRAQADAAASALQETRVRIAEAKLEERRAARLRDQQISSQADLDKARAQVNALEARLNSQRDEFTVAQRQVNLRQQDVRDTEIRAPFAGIVVSKNAQAGEMISPMSAGGGFTRTGIATIVDMDSLEIEIDVNEAYINRVKPGQRVKAILDAYPEWEIPAHVITVIPTADREKATVKVRIAIDQRDPRILPDMGVKVSFIAEAGADSSPRRLVVIPSSAVRRDGERDIVFIVKDGRAERRAVTVKGSRADRVEVLSGLSSGETVVTTGPADLKDGQRVRVEQESKS